MEQFRIASDGEHPLPPISRRFLSVARAAPLLDVSKVTLYRAIQDLEFPAIKIRGRYVIPSKVIDAMEDTAIRTGAVVDAADWVGDHDSIGSGRPGRDHR